MSHSAGKSVVKATSFNAGLSCNGSNYVSAEQNKLTVASTDLYINATSSGKINMTAATFDCSIVSDFIGVYARFK